jgi:hypothetical protein
MVARDTNTNSESQRYERRVTAKSGVIASVGSRLPDSSCRNPHYKLMGIGRHSLQRGVFTVKNRDHVQSPIDTGRQATGGDDLAVVDHALIIDDVDLRVGLPHA